MTKVGGEGRGAARQCRPRVTRSHPRHPSSSGGNAPSNEGGPAWLNNKFFGDLNPAFWQAIDRRVEAMNSYGFVVSMAIGIGRRFVGEGRKQSGQKLPPLAQTERALQLFLCPAHALSHARSMTDKSQLADHMRLSLYMTARYSGFNTVWVTCQGERWVALCWRA